MLISPDSVASLYFLQIDLGISYQELSPVNLVNPPRSAGPENTRFQNGHRSQSGIAVDEHPSFGYETDNPRGLVTFSDSSFAVVSSTTFWLQNSSLIAPPRSHAEAPVIPYKLVILLYMCYTSTVSSLYTWRESAIILSL